MEIRDKGKGRLTGMEKARIALLEGQRRSAENLKVDLLRRAKMLEFALRQERTANSQNSVGKASGIAPARYAALQDEDRPVKEEKEGSGSEGSEEGGEFPRCLAFGKSSDQALAGDRMKPSTSTSSLPNGVHPAAMTKTSTISYKTDTAAWKNTGGISRDPKSRARSRDYLKQYVS